MNPRQHRIYMSVKYFVIISAIMLLPWLGGIIELFTPGKDRFDGVHLFCVLPCLVYFVWLQRFFGRHIEVDENGVVVQDWFETRVFRFSEKAKAMELIIAVEDHGTGRYMYIPHLFVVDNEKQKLIRGHYIQKYDDLKRTLESVTKSELESMQVEKSSWVKSMEFLEKIGMTK